MPPDERPDPRFTLANERTFLAWVRTSLALLAGGVALHTLDLPGASWARTLLAVVLVLLGGVSISVAWWRWRRVEEALASGAALPRFRAGLGLTVVLAAVALALVLMLVM